MKRAQSIRGAPMQLDADIMSDVEPVNTEESDFNTTGSSDASRTTDVDMRGAPRNLEDF